MTQEYTLRAMATNYAGGHCWDHLDGETCVKAADEIKALRSDAQGWQEISTAAKDGTPMLFCNYDDPEQDVLPIVSGFWSRLSEGWYAELSGQKIKPTHWRPLLAPPTLAVSRPPSNSEAK